MAALAVPLASAFLPIIIKFVDKLIGSKTPTTPNVGEAVKFPLAVSIAQAVEGALVNGGQASPAQATDPAVLKAQVQKTVTDLNGAGVLKGHDTVLDAATVSAIPPGLRALGFSMLHAATAILETPGV